MNSSETPRVMSLRSLVVLSALLVGVVSCKGESAPPAPGGSKAAATARGNTAGQPSDEFPAKFRRTMNPARAVHSMSGAADAAYKHYQDGAGTNYGAMSPAAERLVKRARFLGTVDDYDRALAVASHMVENQRAIKGPNLLKRAKVYAALHRWEDARADIQESLKYRVAQRAVDSQLATIDLAQGKTERALAFRRNWVERKPDYINLASLGVVLMEMGEFEEADRRFNQALNVWNKSYPFDLAWILFQKGRMREAQDQKAEARKLYQLAYERFPQ